jgi:SAM-dependent methyltransferase
MTAAGFGDERQAVAALPMPSRYVGREPFILDRCAGKEVLHLGFIGETSGTRDERLSFITGGNSLHARLTKVAGRVAGVDLDEDMITYLRNRGVAEIYAGSAEALHETEIPPSRFDVIVAGDIIEHVSNPGRLLDSARTFLDPDGVIIITTPNAFGLPNYLRFMRGKYSEGPEHVHSYTPFTLTQLVVRHGWDPTEIYACYQEGARAIRGNVVFRVGAWILSKYPRFGGTLLYVCRPRP